MSKEQTSLKKRILILLLISAIVSSCHRSPDLTEDEIYDILNEIIADDSLIINRVCGKINNFPNHHIAGFTEEDLDFIDRQKEVFHDFEFAPHRLKSYSPRKKTMDYVEVDSICSTGFYWYLSFPLISANRQRVVIEWVSDCVGCILAGQGSTDIYVKQNGHWKKEQSLNQWISETAPFRNKTPLAVRKQAIRYWTREPSL